MIGLLDFSMYGAFGLMTRVLGLKSYILIVFKPDPRIDLGQVPSPRSSPVSFGYGKLKKKSTGFYYVFLRLIGL
jgi:hypothetical protein